MLWPTKLEPVVLMDVPVGQVTRSPQPIELSSEQINELAEAIAAAIVRALAKQEPR